ncbi:MAG: transcriptional repressor [Campylobacterales bacterium]|nr:transcriptional repressor [Campylobacterales bacterium]
MEYAKILNERGLKATPQRIEILNQLKIKGHLSVDEIFTEVKAIFSSVSLATIYKNIISLQDINLIEEVKIPNHKTKYQLTLHGEHIHVFCVSCHDLTDYKFEFEKFEESIKSSTNYDIQNVDIYIRGICPKCKSKM